MKCTKMLWISIVANIYLLFPKGDTPKLRLSPEVHRGCIFPLTSMINYFHLNLCIEQKMALSYNRYCLLAVTTHIVIVSQTGFFVGYLALAQVGGLLRSSKGLTEQSQASHLRRHSRLDLKDQWKGYLRNAVFGAKKLVQYMAVELTEFLFFWRPLPGNCYTHKLCLLLKSL